MCGPKHCPMNSKISDETLDELNNKLTKCETAV
jgi:phosphomethylpyrimidine synthase